MIPNVTGKERRLSGSWGATEGLDTNRQFLQTCEVTVDPNMFTAFFIGNGDTPCFRDREPGGAFQAACAAAALEAGGRVRLVFDWTKA